MGLRCEKLCARGTLTILLNGSTLNQIAITRGGCAALQRFVTLTFFLSSDGPTCLPRVRREATSTARLRLNWLDRAHVLHLFRVFNFKYPGPLVHQAERILNGVLDIARLGTFYLVVTD